MNCASPPETVNYMRQEHTVRLNQSPTAFSYINEKQHVPFAWAMSLVSSEAYNNTRQKTKVQEWLPGDHICVPAPP